MLYYLSMHDVQMLLLSFMSVMLLASWLSIYIPRRTSISAACMILIFVVSYHTIIASSAMTGKPSFDSTGMSGVLGGFLPFIHGDKQYIAILVKTADGPELFAIPYSQPDDEALQESMRKWIELGLPQMVSDSGVDKDLEEANGKKTTQEQGGGDGQEGGRLVTHDFAQDNLPPKKQ